MPLNISHSNSRPKFNRPKLQQSGEILVRGYVDQTGQKWVRVGFQGKWAFAPRAELVSTSSAFFQRLERQDVAILDPKLQASIRTQAQDAAYKKKAYVVDRLGWHGDTYIQPDTPLPKFIASVRVIDDRKVSQADWGTGGSPKEWRAGIKRFVAGQALPTFVLGCAFASLIAHLLPEIDENVGFNLSDESSIGKSKLLLLAATVFGRPRRFRRTWHTTVNALEKTFALRGNSLFTLDELNLFLDSEPDANKKVGLAVHQLAAGSEKARYDDPGQRDHRCVFSAPQIPRLLRWSRRLVETGSRRLRSGCPVFRLTQALAWACLTIFPLGVPTLPKPSENSRSSLMPSTGGLVLSLSGRWRSASPPHLAVSVCRPKSGA